VKICVLVKEVPDAAVEKRIDPSTGRMDRSGEKNLNPFDTHAIEAAMQLKEGGALQVDEVVAVTMGPDSAVRALHKAVSLGADRSIHLSDDALAGSTSTGRATHWPRRSRRSRRTSSCSASSPTTASATRSAPWWPTTSRPPR
jgi:electron transfer flavoprotein alpha/beta subunit